MAESASAPPIEMRLIAIRYVARDTHLFEFARLDGGVLPDTEPGAHIGLHLPNGLMRQYSLVSARHAPRSYVVGIKRDPQSRGGSRFIHDNLKVGALVKVDPPRNNFPLAEDAAPTVLIAGGIGITPIMAMVERLRAEKRDWRLFYSCRSREDAAFREELESTGAVTFHFDADTGKVLDMAAVIAAVPADAHLYCCGPAPMLAAFETATANRPRERIHVEYFTARHEAATGGGYTVQLSKTGRDYAIGPGQTILAVLRDAGVDVAYSCEEGICGACETRVVSGTPDHRDSILSEAERAAGKTMMICCSGSKTARLVLDL